MKIKSKPIKSLDADTIRKLAYRSGLDDLSLQAYHVTFFEDEPNWGQGVSQGYSPRAITMAVITAKPLTLEAVALGSCIKSPDDIPDPSRGETIALSRAIRSL